MTTNNSSFVPIQYPQHNVVHPQVCITYIYDDVPLLSCISMQTLGVRDHELWSNEHLPGISGPYPAVNPADSDALPPGPTRYTSTMGNEDRDPPRVPVVIVSVYFIGLHILFADGGFTKGRWTTSREPNSPST